ncbi:hypothetical protein RQP46_005089 [Phenoliferia psychrophenolica]
MSSAKVALVTGGASDIDEAGGKKVVEEIEGKGGKATFVRLDVGSEVEWAEAVKRTVATYGALDVLVNNDDTLEAFEKVMSITSTSVFLGCKAAADELKKAGRRGSVLRKEQTKTIAIAWAPHGVRCNSVHPGFIDTPLVHSAGGGTTERLARLAAMAPLNRLGTVEEIANCIAFLASDDSSFMTGSELVCDGGYTAQ